MFVSIYSFKNKTKKKDKKPCFDTFLCSSLFSQLLRIRMHREREIESHLVDKIDIFLAPSLFPLTTGPSERIGTWGRTGSHQI